MEITKVTVASQRLTKSSTTGLSSRARLSRNDVILRGSSKLSLDDPDSPSLIIRTAVTLHLFQSNIHSEMAYREFIEQYQSKVYQFAYGILGDREEADEIAQKVFVEVYFSAKWADAPSCVYAWICRIAVNECYGFLRKKRLDRCYENDAATNATSGAMPRDPCLKPDREWRDLLNTLLERLPEEDRYLLLLREIEGYSPAQLSEMTSMSEPNIRGRLFRARQRLAEEFRCDAPLTGKS
jgi:RNA polymerase sigma-70 factor, ECF subfamily